MSLYSFSDTCLYVTGSFSVPVLRKPFPVLRTITIGTLFLGEKHQPVERLDWIRRFITKFPSVPKLQTITLDFFFSRAEDVLMLLRDPRWSWESFFWTVQKNCPALKRFVLRFDVDTNLDIALPLKQELEAAVRKKVSRRSPTNKSPLLLFRVEVEWGESNPPRFLYPTRLSEVVIRESTGPLGR